MASKTYACCENVQHKAIRTFLGTGKKSPPTSYSGPKSIYANRKKSFDTSYVCVNFLMKGLNFFLFNLDYSWCAQGKKNWSKDAKKNAL